MFIKINIECEDYRELQMHLKAIKKNFKSLEKANPDELMETTFTDNNCYGTHEVEVFEEQPKGVALSLLNF